MDDRYAPPAAEGLTGAGKASTRAGVYEYFAQPTGTRAVIGCLPLLVSCAVAALFGILDLTAYALPAAGLTLGALWWRGRRQLALPQATLSIAGSRLRIVDRDARELLFMPLDELLEVELDTKTIQRVEDNASAGVLPHFRLLHGQVGSATDVSRIVLVTTKLELPLSEERMSSSYTNESFGQMRRFLRSHGWLPEGERSAAAP